MKGRSTRDGISPCNHPAPAQVSQKRGCVGNLEREFLGIAVSNYIGEMYVA
jgi:hypothetical protein